MDSLVSGRRITPSMHVRRALTNVSNDVQRQSSAWHGEPDTFRRQQQSRPTTVQHKARRVTRDISSLTARVTPCRKAVEPGARGLAFPAAGIGAPASAGLATPRLDTFVTLCSGYAGPPARHSCGAA
jgi:hypothetical protein